MRERHRVLRCLCCCCCCFLEVLCVVVAEYLGRPNRPAASTARSGLRRSPKGAFYVLHWEGIERTRARKGGGRTTWHEDIMPCTADAPPPSAAGDGGQGCQMAKLRPHALHPGAIQGKEGIQFCHLATLKVERRWRDVAAAIVLLLFLIADRCEAGAANQRGVW